MLLRRKVSSDKEQLQTLHNARQWVPGKDHLRPSLTAIESKNKLNDVIKTCYASEADYIFEKVFCFGTTIGSNGFRSVDAKLVAQKKVHRFERNQFPYDVPAGTRHFVMWYTCDSSNLTEELINSHIEGSIWDWIGHNRFDFVWYENPKMTIPEIFHVQVFWTVVQTTAVQKDVQRGKPSQPCVPVHARSGTGNAVRSCPDL